MTGETLNPGIEQNIIMENTSNKTAPSAPAQPTVSGSTSIANSAPRAVDPIIRSYVTDRFIHAFGHLHHCLNEAFDALAGIICSDDETRPINIDELVEQLRQRLVVRGLITDSNQTLAKILDECLCYFGRAKKTKRNFIMGSSNMLVADLEDDIFALRKLAHALKSAVALRCPEYRSSLERPVLTVDENKTTGSFASNADSDPTSPFSAVPKGASSLFIDLIAVPPPQQSADLITNADFCPRLLTLHWTIASADSDTFVDRVAYILPEGFTVTDEMLASPGLTAECISALGLTAKYLIKYGLPVKFVLQQLVADVEQHRPTDISVLEDNYGKLVLAAEFSRLGFFPSWLPIPQLPNER